jgi:CubicO group peptidase (beta-lactamase class C family)
MKTILFIVALFTANALYAQTLDQTDKIKEVENNLTGQIQVEGDKPMNLQDRMAFFKNKGLSIAVIQNYHIIWAKGYGWADEGLEIPVTAQTLFQAASISKSLNAVGVLKLVQDKKLDLYTDINTYLTSWKFPYDSLTKGKKITVANLLSHTAGLTVHGFGGYEQGQELPTPVQILDGKKPANSAAVRSMYASGLKSEYSGGGIVISQQVVMDITHQPYAQYMYEAVLKPLGMTGSTYAQPPTGINPKLLATAYTPDGKELPGKYHIYPEQAAAGLWTTPTDLAKYIIETQLAYEGKSAKVLDQTMTITRLTPYIDKSAALGVFIDDFNGTKYFEHGGSNEGFKSQYYGSLQDGNGVVIMVNSDNSGIIPEIVNSVAKVYHFKGLDRSILKKIVTVDDVVLESYTGEYALSPTFILTVTKEGHQLITQATGQGQVAVYAETQVKFFPKNFVAELEFIKDTTGNVTAVMLYQNGHQQEAKKIK